MLEAMTLKYFFFISYTYKKIHNNPYLQLTFILVL